MKPADKIKSDVDLRDAMEYYGIQFNRKGYAICPFHNEKTASLSVKNGRFKCFGCGASGDVISFVRMHFNLDFGQALVRLNSDFRLGLTSCRSNIRSQAIAKERHEKRLQLKAQKKLDCRVYLAVADAHARLMRAGIDKDELDLLEDWLDKNIGMGVTAK